MKIFIQLLFLLPFLTCKWVVAPTETTNPVNLSGFDKKKQLALAIGAGVSNFQFRKSNWQQGTINYNDSLNSIQPASVLKFDITLLYLFNLNKTFSVRPAFSLSFEGGKLQYNKQATVESLDLTTVSAIMPLPILYKFRRGNVQPYFSFGPSLLLMLGQAEASEPVLPIKRFDVLGDAGIGMDIDVPKWKMIVSPEIKYSTGLLNQKGDANNLYSNTIQSLKRQFFTFTIYLRDR